MNKLSQRLAGLSREQRELLRMRAEKRGLRWSASPSETDRSSRRPVPPQAELQAVTRRLSFSLLFFSSDGSKDGGDKYGLLFECARFADRNGFEAVWTPERHFQDFGGLYPNPSVLSAALAAMTERVEIRAGSLVLPLHNPIRVAEDWAVLDNLSGGRVALSIATGWSDRDFALSPGSYGERRELTFEGIELLRRLWSGETLRVPGGKGDPVEIRLLPRPLQPELPIWVTSSGTPETWIRAGEIGANVLSGLGDDMASYVRRYRAARSAHGHDPEAGRVTVMAHTFLGDDLEAVKKQVRGPMIRYLRTFARNSAGLRPGRAALSQQELDDLAEFGFEEHFRFGSLLGTPESCRPVIQRLKNEGVDEVACLIDFGLDPETVLGGLEHLKILKESEDAAAASASVGKDAGGHDS